MANNYKKPVSVEIDLLLADNVKKRLSLYDGKTVGEFFLGFMNTKVSEFFINETGLSKGTVIDQAVERIILDAEIGKICIDAPVRTRSFENSQACMGGISLDSINGDCESQITPGLFFTGEILDIDGICGGYNLQWAWTTGYLAGCSAAK